MAGLEIISQEPIMTISILSFVLIVLSMVLLISILPGLMFKLIHRFHIKHEAMVATVFGLIIVAIAFGEFILFSKPSGCSKYTANITEECRLTEFAEQYIIIHKNEDGTYLITDDLNFYN